MRRIAATLPPWTNTCGLPAGASATVRGERTAIGFTRDGAALVAVVTGADGVDEPPVRLAPLDAWPLVRDRLR
ncbi:hypothetical protein ACQP1P_28975 [Dactylosporangium sp. CA-052675]|uniref:hypothetical protein n=1 Tax=Dactylosporangium sp. CA-052675 TaxID=3239927 RepID=UPI003D8CD1E0